MPKFVSPSGRQYTQKKELGTGAFGNIIVCKDSEHEKDFIIKRVRLARQTPQERFSSVQELAMMQQLRHRNLIRGLDGWLVISCLLLVIVCLCLLLQLLVQQLFLAGEQAHNMPRDGKLQRWRLGKSSRGQAGNQTGRAGYTYDDCAGLHSYS